MIPNDDSIRIRPADFAELQQHAAAATAALLEAEEDTQRRESLLAETQRKLAATEKLLAAYQVLLTGSLVVNAHAESVDPAVYAPSYFEGLLLIALNSGAFADEGVDGFTFHAVCDQLHLPRFQLEQEESHG